MGTGVGVRRGIGVAVGSGALVGVGAGIGVGVAVGSGALVGVGAGIGVGVAVGSGAFVGVGAGIGVGVAVGTGVEVSAGIAVCVGVRVEAGADNVGATTGVSGTAGDDAQPRATSKMTAANTAHFPGQLGATALASSCRRFCRPWSMILKCWTRCRDQRRAPSASYFCCSRSRFRQR